VRGRDVFVIVVLPGLPPALIELHHAADGVPDLLHALVEGGLVIPERHPLHLLSIRLRELLEGGAIEVEELVVQLLKEPAALVERRITWRCPRCTFLMTKGTSSAPGTRARDSSGASSGRAPSEPSEATEANVTTKYRAWVTPPVCLSGE